MNSKQQKTFNSLFDDPVKKTIKWMDVKNIIVGLESEIKQGNGSRVRIVLGDSSLNIHSPHPQKELKPYQVRAIRELLRNQGIA